jgi:hypothetical protein
VISDAKYLGIYTLVVFGSGYPISRVEFIIIVKAFFAVFHFSFRIRFVEGSTD